MKSVDARNRTAKGCCGGGGAVSKVWARVKSVWRDGQYIQLYTVSQTAESNVHYKKAARSFHVHCITPGATSLSFTKLIMYTRGHSAPRAQVLTHVFTQIGIVIIIIFFFLFFTNASRFFANKVWHGSFVLPRTCIGSISVTTCDRTLARSPICVHGGSIIYSGVQGFKILNVWLKQRNKLTTIVKEDIVSYNKILFRN